MSGTKEDVIFYSVIVLAFLSAGLEVYLIHFIVIHGKIATAESVIALLNGAASFGAVKLILDAWKIRFGVIARTATIESEDLHNCYMRRLQIVSPLDVPKNAVVPQVNRQLITQYLILLESLLKKNLGNYHYELSVFCNKEHPEIVAYYDSASNCIPRTWNERKKDPEYYKKNKYKVVELLCNPSAETIFIEDIDRESDQYSFNSKEQKHNIKSTLLHCIQSQWPAVLVITCNQKQVLGDSSEFKEAFISVYNAIATDLNLSLIIKSGEELTIGVDAR